MIMQLEIVYIQKCLLFSTCSVKSITNYDANIELTNEKCDIDTHIS